MKKRKLLLLVSVVVLLQLWYYGMRDFYEVSRRFSQKPVVEENQVPDFLPPDTVIINVGHREGSIRYENHELILGGIMKWVLGGGFFAWCFFMYRQEKRAEEFAAEEKRKNEQREINIMLDKEKRWEKYGEKEEKEE